MQEKREETHLLQKELIILLSLKRKILLLSGYLYDEAHEFLPLEGKSLASDALINY